MKKLAILGLFFLFSGLILQEKETIFNYVEKLLSNFSKPIELGVKNNYYRDYDFIFVQNTDNFSPKNFQDVINIYYTAINAGKDSFTFKCDKEYIDCIKDVQGLANNQNLLSDINNYVHPYNSFTHIETTYDNFGNVTLSVVKAYNDNQIKEINTRVDELYPTLVKSTLSDESNIKNIHDYIINNTKYDSARSNNNDTTYKSDIAYGVLFQGYAICGGYSDAMAIFLNKMNIPNFKVSSEKHVWNAVYVNNQWVNLDLTWDDPVASDDLDYLEYDYFLIDSDELINLEKTEHNFNKDSYPELLNIKNKEQYN